MSAGPKHIAFYPSDWLAGTRGMTAAETGVYITLTAMMYERAAPLDMDRPRLARLCGIPAGAFAKVLRSLVSDGKIQETQAGIWNSRVAKELQIAREKSGAAKASADVRWSSEHLENATDTMDSAIQKSEANTPKNANEINDPPMRSQCERNANQNQNHTQTEEGAAAGSASANPVSPTLFREHVLVAAGHDASGMAANGRMLGNAADMLAVNAWTADLGLTQPEILTIISELTARSGPQNNLRYFTPAMRRFAGLKTRPPMTPEETQNGNADRNGAQTGSARRGGFSPFGRQGAGQGRFGGGMAGAAARSEARDRAAMDVPHGEEWRELAQLSDRDEGFGSDIE